MQVTRSLCMTRPRNVSMPCCHMEELLRVSLLSMRQSDRPLCLLKYLSWTLLSLISAVLKYYVPSHLILVRKPCLSFCVLLLPTLKWPGLYKLLLMQAWWRNHLRCKRSFPPFLEPWTRRQSKLNPPYLNHLDVTGVIADCNGA